LYIANPQVTRAANVAGTPIPIPVPRAILSLDPDDCPSIALSLFIALVLVILDGIKEMATKHQIIINNKIPALVVGLGDTPWIAVVTDVLVGNVRVGDVVDAIEVVMLTLPYIRDWMQSGGYWLDGKCTNIEISSSFACVTCHVLQTPILATPLRRDLTIAIV